MPSYLSAHVTTAEREYLEDLAERVDTSISGALRIALFLALLHELNAGEIEVLDQAVEDDGDGSGSFDDLLDELRKFRRGGRR